MITTRYVVAAFALVATATSQAQTTKPDDNSDSQASVPVSFLGGDTYGYDFQDDAGADCSFNFIDISGTGAAVTFTASATFPADDDGGAALTLSDPFEYYGTATNDVVMSTNGYIAVGTAGGLANESGGDFSNDCPIPATPSVQGVEPASANRMMPFHDDLSGDVADSATAAAFSQYFATCPRAGESGGDEACTVLQWDDWSFFGGGDVLDIQVVLYHTSFEFVYQFDTVAGAPDGAGATFGWQDSAATDGINIGCNTAISTSSRAFCVFDPRFPAGSLSVPSAVTTSTPNGSMINLLGAAPGSSASRTISFTNTAVGSGDASLDSCSLTSGTDFVITAPAGFPQPIVAGGAVDVIVTGTVPANGADATDTLTCTFTDSSGPTTVTFALSIGLPQSVPGLGIAGIIALIMTLGLIAVLYRRRTGNQSA